MDSLVWRGAIASFSEELGAGISDIAVVEQSGQSYVVTTTGQSGGLMSFSLGSGNLASLTDRHYFTATEAQAVSGRLSLVDDNGSEVLAFGVDPGGNAIGVAINPTGQIGAPMTLSTPTTAGQQDEVLAVQSASGFLFMAGADGQGGFLTCYRSDGSGGYTAGQTTRDAPDSHLAAPRALDVVGVSGQEYLVTLCGDESGVSAWLIDQNSGHVTQTGAVGAASGLGILASPLPWRWPRWPGIALSSSLRPPRQERVPP